MDLTNTELMAIIDALWGRRTHLLTMLRTSRIHPEYWQNQLDETFQLISKFAQQLTNQLEGNAL